MSEDKPLITHLYTADPSAHSFEGRIYIYPSHDRETDIADNDNGDQYDMNDYHVFSLASIPDNNSNDNSSPPPQVVDHGVILKQSDIPWATKQLWAPDCAARNGRYYFYFPARDEHDIFRIGVAEAAAPAGPFVPDPSYIPGSYSIDPASFVDDDEGQTGYLYFGGIWGGQLQCWQKRGTDGDGERGEEEFDASWSGPQEPSGDGVAALLPRVARLREDMHGFAEAPREVRIVDEDGELLAADDHARRFFEAAWMHKYNGKYYFSYSTGDTHYIVYATGDSPYGPFTYQGRILEPVVGWTTHHSICEHEGRWYLFHHDSSLSGGKNHLRSVKVKEIFYDADGKIHLRGHDTL